MISAALRGVVTETLMVQNVYYSTLGHEAGKSLSIWRYINSIIIIIIIIISWLI